MAWFSELISRMLKKNKTVVQTTCLKDVLIRLISLSLSVLTAIIQVNLG